MINMDHELIILSIQIDWTGIHNELLPLYSEVGRPSVPARTMVGLLMLKRMFNQSDESVIDRWIENPYWQYFTGEQYFQKTKPFDPSEFVHFRKRVGEQGLEKLLTYSVKIHKDADVEKEVQVDTTVQEKNITFPTDAKLARKVIEKCWVIARHENTNQRQSYKRTVRQLMKEQYNSGHPRRAKKARRARKRLKTIAGRLIRELSRELTPQGLVKYKDSLDLFTRVIHQNKTDKNKIYSLHELNVSCIAKGKAHKKYEFGSKVALVRGSKTGVITGAKSFKGNPHDSKTLKDTLAQSIRVRKHIGGNTPQIAITDRGFRGAKMVEGVKIEIPTNGKGKTKYQKTKNRKRFRNRAGIEPVIGHIKHDHRMLRNYLKGIAGDLNNALLAAMGYNLKKRLNQIKAATNHLFDTLILNTILLAKPIKHKLNF
jgi:IS5 family transposase